MKVFVFWIPAVAFAILIFSLSHQSHPPGKDTAPDYILHFFEYGIFTLTVLIGITRLFRLKLNPKRLFFTLLIVLVFAATDELHQSFIPHRDGSLRDWISDTVGAVTFLIGAWLVQKAITGNKKLDSQS